MLDTFREVLDLRSKWLGLRQLRKGYAPAPYHRKSQGGQHIPMGRRAEEAADYLSKVQWGKEDNIEAGLPKNKIITEEVQIRQDEIHLEELNAAVKKMKNRKSGGPDDMALEMFEAMEEEARKEVFKMLNKCWKEEKIDNKALRARVVHIYKKGTTSDLANYRPISLLNTMYKLFASIVQNRLVNGIDQHMHGTQYGFRNARSTQQAIHII